MSLLPLRDVTGDGSDRPDPSERRCPVRECQRLLRPRQRYCSGACRQAAFRQRHATPPPPPVKLPRHFIVYECPECEQRYLGERRCPDCNLFTRRIGVGDACPHCGEPVAVTDLVP